MTSVRDIWEAFREVRFLVVGLWNFVFGYLAFAGLYWVFSSVWFEWVIVLVANVLGITNSFVTHRCITYRSNGVWWKEYLRFYLVYAIQILVNILLVWIFVGKLGFNAFLVQLIVMTVLTLASYWGHQLFSFREVL